MNQLSLFAPFATVAAALEQPVARRTDPETSHQAARAITQSGKREGQLLAVIALVRQYPGKTSLELARCGHTLDRYQLARRLPELEKAGKVRKGSPKKCGVSEQQAHTWWPA